MVRLRTPGAPVDAALTLTSHSSPRSELAGPHGGAPHLSPRGSNLAARVGRGHALRADDLQNLRALGEWRQLVAHRARLPRPVSPRMLPPEQPSFAALRPLSGRPLPSSPRIALRPTIPAKRPATAIAEARPPPRLPGWLGAPPPTPRAASRVLPHKLVGGGAPPPPLPSSPPAGRSGFVGQQQLQEAAARREHKRAIAAARYNELREAGLAI